MHKMFQSATLKLTGYYLLILMIISVTFSVTIYQLNFREISFRLENLQHTLLEDAPIGYMQGNVNSLYNNGPGSPLFVQSSQASNQMVLSLIYINVILLVAGGLGCYFLARRTLRPIEAAHEAQSRFTSDAAHELRTPLAAMKAELEVTIRDTKISEDEARELMQSNLEEVNKLINLSEMLLHLSRLEHGKLEQTSVDLNALIESVLKMFSSDKKRFELTMKKKLETVANEPAIRELLTILIENAIKYSPPKSKIAIRTYQRLGDYAVEIHNASEPISDEKLQRIFDRFYRIDTSRTNSGQNGYGLGLSIAKKIADIHHGEIFVKNNEKGTTFTIFLPILRKVQAKAQPTVL